MKTHITFLQGISSRELASMFNSSICILSSDDMTKAKLGPPAVSRYHQIRRYFLGTHPPNMPDHDLRVIGGYLLSVSGYIYAATLSTQVLGNHDQAYLVCVFLENIAEFDGILIWLADPIYL